MKNKILFLIIGILIGGIITTSAFLIYNKTLEKNSNRQEIMQINKNGQMQPPSDGDMGKSLEKSNQNRGTSPKMPSSSNSNNI